MYARFQPISDHPQAGSQLDPNHGGWTEKCKPVKETEDFQNKITIEKKRHRHGMAKEAGRSQTLDSGPRAIV